MKTCHRCYFYRELEHGSGECMNRPPHGYTIVHASEAGTKELETFAVRPPVRWDDWCAFFSSTKKKED